VNYKKDRDNKKRLQDLLALLEKEKINFIRHECLSCHRVWYWFSQEPTCRSCGSVKINISSSGSAKINISISSRLLKSKRLKTKK